MKRHTVIILWVIALVLGITAYFVKFHDSTSEIAHTQLSPGDKILPALVIRELTTVTLSQGDDSTTLVRGENNLWTVKERSNYPANHELLRNLLGALSQLRVTQGYPCSDQYFGRFGLADQGTEESDLGLRVQMSDSSNTMLADIFLGKYNGATRETMGRFIRLATDNSGVYAAGETFPGVYADAPAWLEPEFIKIQNIHSISLTAPDDPTFLPWTIAKATPAPKDQLKLADIAENEILRLTATSSLAKLFSYASFQDVFTQAEAVSSTLPVINPEQKLNRQAVITTFQGLTYTINYWPEVPGTRKAPTTRLTTNMPLPPAQPGYFLTVEIDAQLPSTRNKSAEESPEDSKKNDLAFQAEIERLNQHITFVKTLKGLIFKVGHSTLAPLEKSRSDFVISK